MTTESDSRWIGKAVPRREDMRLVRGAATYVCDVDVPGMLHMAVLRSSQAHARIVDIDIGAAERLEGVRAVITARDLSGSVLPLPVLWRLPDQKESDIPALAGEKVRYVGEPIAVVVADSRYLAEDALELIRVEYDPLLPIVDPRRAMEPDAPVINDGWGENVGATYVFEGGDVESAFAEADEVVSAEFHINRYSGVPMEGRDAVASWDDITRTLTIWSSSQSPHSLRHQLASSLGLPEHAIRIITPDIGGGFGVKFDTYPEDLLICAVTLRLGRPVKWVEDRREHFQATVHAREQLQEWKLALKSDGTILGLRGSILCDLGAHFHIVGMGPAWSTGSLVPNLYKFSNYRAEVVAVATNKTPNSTYRGFGGPEAAFAIERLMDKAARRLVMDPAEIRQRNFVQASEFPYTNPAGSVYDSGDYARGLQRALELADYPGLRREQAELWKAGVRRGIGISCYVYVSGFCPSYLFGLVGYERSGYEPARVAIDPSGLVTVYTSMVPIGQGTETTLAQVAADRLGIDVADVRVIWGDTSVTPYSDFGTAGSRINLAIGAVSQAIDDLKEKMNRIGAHLLETEPADCEFVDGRVQVRGAGEARFVAMSEVARQAHLAHHLPPGVEPGLDVTRAYDPVDLTWGYGCHIAVLDVDVQTGELSWVKYLAVDDNGTLVNPLLVEGQVHGGVTQGIGGAVLEQLVYDESGQLVTSSFMDYLLPTFNDVPHFEVHHLVTPSPHIPGGFKGVGEGGCIPPGAAIANAVSDALGDLGVEMDRMPITPDLVWTSLRKTGG
jgi:carbon-monoxide dehydrogenase large subunit